jgi:hypothetical protein
VTDRHPARLRRISSQRLLSGILAAAILALVAMACTPVMDADDWLPISPEELKMTADPKAPGAPAIYLYREVDRNDARYGGTERNYVRVKILTEAGREYANIEIPYQDRMTISSIRARTIHPDGSIVNFDGQVFKTAVQKKKDSKIQVKSFTVPDVQIGSIIEYRYTYDFEDYWTFDSHWILSAPLFTRKALFTLKPNKDLAVQWNWPAGLPEGAAKPIQDPLTSMVHMTAENIPAFQEEEYMPPENELKFRVNFIYAYENFESDQNKYWKNFGKKKFGEAESFAKRKGMADAVASIVSPSDTPEVKLRKIYDRCQEIRNLSYERIISSQEVKHDKMKLPENGEEVLKLGYGTGWQITWVFLGLAQAAGLDAHPALVGSRYSHFFNPVRMDSQELTSNLVVVKLDGKDGYYDPGAAFVPFGQLPWDETNVSGRLLDKDGGTWIETPLPPSDTSRITRNAKFRLNDDGSLEGTVAVTYTGMEAQYFRIEQRNADDAARKLAAEDRLKNCIPAAAEIELKNTPDWKGSKTPLVAEFDVKIPGWVSSAGKRTLMPTGFFVGNEKHLFEHANRTYPVYYPFPFSTADDISITLPDGWKVESSPKAINQDAKAVAYTFSADGTPGALRLQRTMRADVFLVPPDKYPILRAFYQFLRTSDDQQVVLSPGSAVAGK